jgi:hypothetical protein
MIDETESVNEALFILLPVLAGIFIMAFYFFIIKPKQNEKRESERQRESGPDIGQPEGDAYDGIINDYPTYHRQQGVKYGTPIDKAGK